MFAVRVYKTFLAIFSGLYRFWSLLSTSTKIYKHLVYQFSCDVTMTSNMKHKIGINNVVGIAWVAPHPLYPFLNDPTTPPPGPVMYKTLSMHARA